MLCPANRGITVQRPRTFSPLCCLRTVCPYSVKSLTIPQIPFDVSADTLWRFRRYPLTFPQINCELPTCQTPDFVKFLATYTIAPFSPQVLPAFCHSKLKSLREFLRKPFEVGSLQTPPHILIRVVVEWIHISTQGVREQHWILP